MIRLIEEIIFPMSVVERLNKTLAKFAVRRNSKNIYIIQACYKYRCNALQKSIHILVLQFYSWIAAHALNFEWVSRQLKSFCSHQHVRAYPYFTKECLFIRSSTPLCCGVPTHVLCLIMPFFATKLIELLVAMFQPTSLSIQSVHPSPSTW